MPPEKKKRVRADSARYAVAAMQDALGAPVAPPAHIHLREGDMPFWVAVIAARAGSTWTDADLAMAANLARCEADIDRLAREIDAEGDTLENAKGTQIVNPKHALLETLSRRAVALSRIIHIHAEATLGRARDGGNKLKAEEAAREVTEGMDAALIPGLRVVR